MQTTAASTSRTFRLAFEGARCTLSCDLSQASAPLRVDGRPIGRQVADARHRVDAACLLAARSEWPEGGPDGLEWPSVEDLIARRVADGSAWDALAYEEVEAPAAIDKIMADLGRWAIDGGFLVYDRLTGEGGAHYTQGSQPPIGPGQVVIPLSRPRLSRDQVERLLAE